MSTSDRSAGPSPSNPLLTVRETADFLRLTTKAVYRRRERGQLPEAVYVGHSLRFRRSDLLRFVAEGRGPSPGRNR